MENWDNEPEGHWGWPRPPATKEERSKLFGKVLEILIRETFKNHIYTYRNSLYKQRRGGAIGLRLTGVVARIVMDSWGRKFLRTLSRAEIEVLLMKKYVDDVNLVTGILEKGWRWVRQETGSLELEWTEERYEEDVRKNEPDEVRSMERMREMASSLVEGIVFTVDLPINHESKRVPMIDITVWLDQDHGGNPRVRHTYFEKVTTSPLVFHRREACSSKQKIVTLAEEARRRLTNQDKSHSVEERIQELRKFSQKMIDS